jgi:hypothetical protein
VRERVARLADEGAVTADVAAEVRERQKDFARVGGDAALVRVAQLGGSGKQLGQRLVRRLDQRVRILAPPACVNAVATRDAGARSTAFMLLPFIRVLL